MPTALDYEHYLSTYNHCLSGDERRDADWHRQAEQKHALSVNDALVDVMTSGIQIARSFEGTDAEYQLTHGFGRRLKFIWLSVRSLMSVCPPGRREPMSSEEVEATARELNIIYINVRGCLDNLAWSLPSVVSYTGDINPMSVDLFSERYISKIGATRFQPALAEHRGWASELAMRRNPAAHRIPLSVPPAILDKQSSEQFRRAYRAFEEAQARALAAVRPGYFPEREFAEAQAAFEATEKIGVFLPVFVHHPDDGHTPIYPTVPSDVGRLLTVATAIFDQMRLSSVARDATA